MAQPIGKIVQIIGPVIDVRFENENDIPNILDALEIERPDGAGSFILECQQDIGENTVRCISMDSTDGMRRGMQVKATGKSITMPIGEAIKGRLFNVVGEAIDGLGAVSKENGYSIHRQPPLFEDLYGNRSPVHRN